MQISPNRSGNYDEGRGSHRVPENINHEYRQRADLIENSIKEYREIKQEIFTPEQLLQILDMKAGGQVNRDVFLQLFERVKKTERSEFNIKDWVNIYLEAEEILISKISSNNIKLNQYYAVENQLHTLLEEELIQVNKKAIKEKRENYFWINVFEAEITKGSFRSQFEKPVFVLVQVGDQQYRTRVSDNLRAPIWNENFKIKVDDNSLKKITVRCIDTDGKEYGYHNFELLAFQDSKKKKAWLQLSSDKETSYIVKVHLSAIMLHSKIEKIQQDINLNDSKIAETTREISDYQSMLDDLYKPFKALNLAEMRHTTLNITGRPSVFSPDYKVGKTERELIDRLNRFTGKFIDNWARWFFYVSIILAVMSVICCIQKPAFFDLAILLFIYGKVFEQELTNEQLRGSLIASIASLMFDIAWIMHFWKDWCSTYPANLPDCMLKNHLLWVILSILPIKGIFITFLWRNSVKFEEFQEQVHLVLRIKKPFLN